MTEQASPFYDAAVVGGGIAGMQSALDLADQGFKVLVVEKQPSIGGKMIGLSKVFPTLDCSSCITTPKMAAVAHHENITYWTYSDVLAVKRDAGRFQLDITKKARYVDQDKCISCRLCEYACPVDVRDEFEGSLGARRAAYIPFTNAMPQLAMIDMEHCTLCGLCAKACPTDAIDYWQKDEAVTVRAKTVIVATGYELLPLDYKAEYHGAEIDNVITSLQMERLLAPHGPYGRVIRPSDGKVPDSIAYVLCAGSRDQQCGVAHCSRVCCMYSIKQAMLLSGSLPLADITIYYMDIRAFGKNYEQFFQNALAMGIQFVKAKVARIKKDDQQNTILRVEHVDEDGRVEEVSHDMTVLSLGIVPSPKTQALAGLHDAEDGFYQQGSSMTAPTVSSVPGLFLCGMATGPKDIVDTIVEAGAAAMEASAYLQQQNSIVQTETVSHG